MQQRGSEGPARLCVPFFRRSYAWCGPVREQWKRMCLLPTFFVCCYLLYLSRPAFVE